MSMNPLRKARLLAGFSMRAVAKRLGVSGQTIWNWENGVAEPKIRHLLAMRIVYGHRDLIEEYAEEKQKECKKYLKTVRR